MEKDISPAHFAKQNTLGTIVEIVYIFGGNSSGPPEEDTQQQMFDTGHASVQQAEECSNHKPKNNTIDYQFGDEI